MFVFEMLLVAGNSSCLGISVQCGDFHNRLEHKVEKQDLYSVLNVFNTKNGDFFSICVTVVVNLAVFMFFGLRLAVNCSINVILFPCLSPLCLYLVCFGSL